MLLRKLSVMNVARRVNILTLDLKLASPSSQPPHKVTRIDTFHRLKLFASYSFSWTFSYKTDLDHVLRLVHVRPTLKLQRAWKGWGGRWYLSRLHCISGPPSGIRKTIADSVPESWGSKNKDGAFLEAGGFIKTVKQRLGETDWLSTRLHLLSPFSALSLPEFTGQI